MSDQSATPRTAAFYAECYKGRDGEWITYTPDSKAWDFARQLEREPAEAERESEMAFKAKAVLKFANSQTEHFERLWYLCRDELEKAEARCGELEADAKSQREWNIAFLKACTHPKAPTQTQWNAIRDKAEEQLAAIDAAIEREGGEDEVSRDC